MNLPAARFFLLILISAWVGAAAGQDVDLWSPLTVAVRNNDAAAVRTLCQQGALKGADASAWALGWAQDAAMVKLLLSLGADVNQHNRAGDTPLLIQAANQTNNHVESSSQMLALIEAGADVHARTNGMTALHYMAETDNVAIATALLAHGADVNDQEYKYSQTPLMLLTQRVRADRPQFGHEMMPLLLSHGAKPNLGESDGSMPLMFVGARPDLVKMLLDAGADPTLRTREGQSALDRATDPQAIELLVKAGGATAAQKKLIEHGLPKNPIDSLTSQMQVVVYQHWIAILAGVALLLPGLPAVFLLMVRFVPSMRESTEMAARARGARYALGAVLVGFPVIALILGGFVQAHNVGPILGLAQAVFVLFWPIIIVALMLVIVLIAYSRGRAGYQNQQQ